MKHRYLFGVEVHELCRDCSGAAYSILSWLYAGKSTVPMYGCGFCDPRNWTLDRYSYRRY